MKRLYEHKKVKCCLRTAFYTIFYYKFIENNNAWGRDWWTHHIDTPAITSWQGLAFELICITHYQQIKAALGISGMATTVSTWYCEADTAEYEERLRNRMWLFLRIPTKNERKTSNCPYICHNLWLGRRQASHHRT